MTDTLTVEKKKEIDDSFNNLIVVGDFTSLMSRRVREMPSAQSVLGKGSKESSKSSNDDKSDSSSQSSQSTVPDLFMLDFCDGQFVDEAHGEIKAGHAPSYVVRKYVNNLSKKADAKTKATALRSPTLGKDSLTRLAQTPKAVQLTLWGYLKRK